MTLITLPKPMELRILVYRGFLAVSFFATVCSSQSTGDSFSELDHVQVSARFIDYTKVKSQDRMFSSDEYYRAILVDEIHCSEEIYRAFPDRIRINIIGLRLMTETTADPWLMDFDDFDPGARYTFTISYSKNSRYNDFPVFDLNFLQPEAAEAGEAEKGAKRQDKSYKK